MKKEIRIININSIPSGWGHPSWFHSISSCAYCGRGSRRKNLPRSPLHNPFKVKGCYSPDGRWEEEIGSRENAVEKFRDLLKKDLSEWQNSQAKSARMAALLLLSDKFKISKKLNLYCHCDYPRQACHCEVIALAVDWICQRPYRQRAR